MRLECEYIFKVKIEDIVLSESSTDKEINEMILLRGRKMMMDHFNNFLFDPQKKIFSEQIICKKIEE